MKFVSIAAAAAVLAGAAQAQAATAGCKLATASVPVTMEGLSPVVDVKVAGKPLKLLLDSGSYYSTLDAKTIAELKLKPAKVEKMGSLLGDDAQNTSTGIGGRERTGGVVVAPTFEFAGVTYAKAPFLTSPEMRVVSGLLGQNMLTGIDNEYDFKNGVMKLVKADGCEATNMAYWATPGMSYSVAPLEPTPDRLDAHTIITVSINGVPMKAYLDSGADTSFVTQRAAARAGVKITDPGVQRAGSSRGLDREVRVWVGPFASVKIGDEEIKNTHLSIGETDATDFDVLLGADFMLAHHIYVANSQRKLYFTYAGGPVFRVPAPDEASASDAPKTGK